MLRSQSLLRIPAVLLALFTTDLVLAEPAMLMLTDPQPHQIVQRIGIAPSSGYAEVTVRGNLPSGVDPHKSTFEYRLMSTGERSAAEPRIEWRSFDQNINIGGTTFTTSVRVPAGGWYRLEMRVISDEFVVAVGTVEPIGVGEVFLVAGQSYATNCNDERFNVSDAGGRVVAFDWAKNLWRVAHDPQPAGDSSDGGSIWPPLGDALVNELRVPIAFANVAVGATSSTQWMPEEKLHSRLTEVGKGLGRFRAVLWQQGESDVIAKTSTEKYVANLVAIRSAAAKAWGFEPPRLLAKSTHHPTVYNDPEGEGRIRAGVDGLLKRGDSSPVPTRITLNLRTAVMPSHDDISRVSVSVARPKCGWRRFVSKCCLIQTQAVRYESDSPRPISHRQSGSRWRATITSVLPKECSIR